YLGSANFSRHGWGFLPDPARANVEAGIVLHRTGAAKRHLDSLIPATVGPPVPLTGAATGRLAKPETPPPESPWPSFLREVTLVPGREDPSKLEMIITMVPELALGEWSLRLVPKEPAAPSTVLFAVTTGREPQVSHRTPL